MQTGGDPLKRITACLHVSKVMQPIKSDAFFTERVGFEPTCPKRTTAFRVRLVMTTSISLPARRTADLEYSIIKLKKVQDQISGFFNKWQPKRSESDRRCRLYELYVKSLAFLWYTC